MQYQLTPPVSSAAQHTESVLTSSWSHCYNLHSSPVHKVENLMVEIREKVSKCLLFLISSLCFCLIIVHHLNIVWSYLLVKVLKRC